jgi:hypothetical protein
METKTKLQSITRQGDIILLDLLCFDPNTKVWNLDAIATRHAQQYLAARSPFLKVKKWAKIDVPGLAQPSDWLQNLPNLAPAYIAKFAYCLQTNKI